MKPILRLVDLDQSQQWNGRGHFFAAAAEAMRRILIENARRKQSQKRAGMIEHADMDQIAAPPASRNLDLLVSGRGIDRIRTKMAGESETGQAAIFCWLNSE